MRTCVVVAGGIMAAVTPRQPPRSVRIPGGRAAGGCGRARTGEGAGEDHMEPGVPRQWCLRLRPGRAHLRSSLTVRDGGLESVTRRCVPWGNILLGRRSMRARGREAAWVAAESPVVVLCDARPRPLFPAAVGALPLPPPPTTHRTDRFKSRVATRRQGSPLLIPPLHSTPRSRPPHLLCGALQCRLAR